MLIGKIVDWVKRTIVQAVVQDLLEDLESGTGRPVQVLTLDAEFAALPEPDAIPLPNGRRKKPARKKAVAAR